MKFLEVALLLFMVDETNQDIILIAADETLFSEEVVQCLLQYLDYIPQPC